jgi:phosphoribosylaminoimidazole carboxylase PurE protein
MPRRRFRPQRSNPPVRPRPSVGRAPIIDPTVGTTEPSSSAGVLIPEPETELEEIEVREGPLVAVVMGAESDRVVMVEACEELKERGISFEETVVSAHRDPEQVREYARGARMRGIKVIIAGAGMAAALPGSIASYTDLPVIGVPIRSENAVSGGLDALLSIAQSPSGVPVACVAINGAQNAAILASRILFA